MGVGGLFLTALTKSCWTQALRFRRKFPHCIRQLFQEKNINRPLYRHYSYRWGGGRQHRPAEDRSAGLLAGERHWKTYIDSVLRVCTD